MTILNIEFKAATSKLDDLERALLEKRPRFVGVDHQVDTYFHVPAGRLKLREGTIENALIFYQRADTAGSKSSEVILYPHQPGSNLKEILVNSLGIKVLVDKRRRIYFIDNVKFHFDTVSGLGTFIEVEAIDRDGSIGREKLQAQCDEYASFLGIAKEDYIAVSYSDMILQKG